MQNNQQVPGEQAGLNHYFSLSAVDRKLVVDLCDEIYKMTRKEQEMILGIARSYVKQKISKQQIAAVGHPRLRLVA